MLRCSLGPAADLELWNWKHVINPFGPSLCVVAEAGGEIVGVRAFMRWTWRSGERHFHALRAVDTATRPDWRRRGVFAALTRELVDKAREDGHDFIFNTPNRLSRPQYLRLGWRPIGHVRAWVRPVGLRPRRKTQLDELPRVEELMAQPGIDRFLAHCAQHQDAVAYRTHRDAHYLDWRYRRAPGVAYRAFWDLSGDHRAAIIFRLRSRGRLTEATVVEILVPPSSDSSASAAAGLLSELARRCGTHYLAALAPPATAARRALRRALFLPAGPVGPVVTVRLLAESLEPDPLRLSNWACSLGDLEFF